MTEVDESPMKIIVGHEPVRHVMIYSLSKLFIYNLVIRFSGAISMVGERRAKQLNPSYWTTMMQCVLMDAPK